jgi:hypothetical protein
MVGISLEQEVEHDLAAGNSPDALYRKLKAMSGGKRSLGLKLGDGSDTATASLCFDTRSPAALHLC